MRSSYYNFVCTMLVPILNPFDGQNTNSVVIMDNASIHHTDSVVSMINATGALIRFLPPYSPDMNPIESAFGEVKHYYKPTASCSTHLFQHILSY